MNRYAGRTAIAAGLAACVFGGCEDGGPTGPEVEPSVDSLTVDAADGGAYVALGANATTVQVQDGSASAAWDVAFFATSVMLNGGAAGPGEEVWKVQLVNYYGPGGETRQITFRSAKLES